MNITELLAVRNDEALANILCRVFDVELFPELSEPENDNGHMAYSIPGKSFAAVGDGSEYILLDDGSVGFWGSEGQCGRIADSLDDFLELVVNCPCWEDVINLSGWYAQWHRVDFADEDSVRVYLRLLEEKNRLFSEREPELSEGRAAVSARLGVTLCGDVSPLVVKLWHCANREPRLVCTYTEDDGTQNESSGSLFED